MAALKDIKRKITGVQKTKQITKAMNMVAASRFKNAYLRMENFRNYSRKLAEVIAGLSARVDLESHPLFSVRDSGRVRLLMISADRGLCGGFNTSLIKYTGLIIKEQIALGKEVTLTPIGRKGRDYFRKRMPLTEEMTDVLGKFDISLAALISDRLIPSFIRGEFDELYLIYNSFINVSVQKPQLHPLLPLGRAGEAPENGAGPDYIYEPSAGEMLDKLLPMHVHVQLHQALVETAAGENGARMVAMDNATRNCDDLIQSLTLKFNKARQAAITAELMDIVGGAEALSQG
ncbi:MAG: ATP synthase F1 subunit gamma [Smithellaceae bacterium]|nr:ATP synthase F1 subunit gamma [Smithellaceae bacterium]